MAKPIYLPNLTALRGIAALLVVLFHFDLLVMPLVPPALTSLPKYGYLFVDFFFILSGFVMMHVYGDWFASPPRRRVFGRFMAARFARLYPLHLFTFGWVVGLYGLLRLANVPVTGFVALIMDPAAIPWHLILVQALVVPAFTSTWNIAAWSISAEWWAYVLFPLLVRPLLRASGTQKVLVGIGLLTGYAWLMGYAIPNQPTPPGLPDQPVTYASINIIHGPLGFLRCLLGFGLGMLTYTLYRQQWGVSWLRHGRTIGLLSGLLLIGWHVVPNLPDLVAVGVFALVILAAVYNTTGTARFLNTKPVQRLGDWSYSIYLVHIPILFTGFVAIMTYPQALSGLPPVGQPLTPVYSPIAPVFCLAFLLITVGVAAFLHRFLEKPARRFLNARFHSGADISRSSILPGTDPENSESTRSSATLRRHKKGP